MFQVWQQRIFEVAKELKEKEVIDRQATDETSSTISGEGDREEPECETDEEEFEEEL